MTAGVVLNCFSARLRQSQHPGRQTFNNNENYYRSLPCFSYPNIPISWVTLRDPPGSLMCAWGPMWWSKPRLFSRHRPRSTKKQEECGAFVQLRRIKELFKKKILQRICRFKHKDLHFTSYFFFVVKQ